jgi:hypothetical protein
MKEVYFDTNVYTHLAQLVRRKNFTAIDKLRKAVLSDQLRILSSFTVLEETAGAFVEYPREAFQRLRLIRKLAKRKKLIKLHFDILNDDITSSATDQPLKSHFMAPFPQLRDLFLGRDLPGLIEVAKKTKESVSDFRNEMRNSFSRHIAPLAQAVIANREVPTFEKNFEDNAIEFVRLMVKPSGQLAACEKRGLDGLLEVPAINVYVRAQLSLVYANTHLGRLHNQGDSRDMQHVLLAATAGVFITQDNPLRKALKRANSPYLTVMSLHELVDTLA